MKSANIKEHDAAGSGKSWDFGPGQGASKTLDCP